MIESYCPSCQIDTPSNLTYLGITPSGYNVKKACTVCGSEFFYRRNYEELRQYGFIEAP
jgi:hypothetical protein